MEEIANFNINLVMNIWKDPGLPEQEIADPFSSAHVPSEMKSYSGNLLRFTTKMFCTFHMFLIDSSVGASRSKISKI